MESKVNNLKNILNKINIRNFNLPNINSNINFLIKVFLQLKSIYNSLNNVDKNNLPYINIKPDNPEYKKIFTYINDYVIMVGSKNLSLKVKQFNKVIKISEQNISFYYIYDSESKLESDLNKIYYMLKISIALNQYIKPNDTLPRYIIWIPINTKRDFDKKIVNKQNLSESNDEYKGFTVSGVTSGNNPRYTIVTRYEEVEKLLLHELIHNLYIDGSNYHSDLKTIIKKYIKIKINPNSTIKNYDYAYSIYESFTELIWTYLYLLFDNINLLENELYDKLLGQICTEILYSYNTISNLARLNNLDTWEKFINSKSFLGNICIYEYYFVKGLMYNNFILELPSSSNDFISMYEKIIDLIKNSSNDKLLEDIFKNSQSQNNYKYIIN